jgi:hypothetical protein
MGTSRDGTGHRQVEWIEQVPRNSLFLKEIEEKVLSELKIVVFVFSKMHLTDIESCSLF